MNTDKGQSLIVLNPLGKSRLEMAKDVLSARAKTLDGKVIGFLDDGVSQVLFDRLRELFMEHCEPAGLKMWIKPNPSKPAPDAIVEEMVAKVNAAVVGTAI